MEVKEFLLKNREIFYKLGLIGISNINTAIDYATIYEEYQKHLFIKSCNEREQVIAERFKVDKRTVRRAVLLMEKKIVLSK